MKKHILLICSVILCTACLGATRSVQTKIEGKYYNEIAKKWYPKPLEVYVDDSGSFYISAGDRAVTAAAVMKLDKLDAVIAAFQKGQEWAKKAKEGEVEISKDIDAFMTKIGSNKETGIKITFFSANKGKQTDVILLVKDFGNMFKKVELYLEPSQVEALIGALKLVPDTCKELKEQAKKAEDFK